MQPEKTSLELNYAECPLEELEQAVISYASHVNTSEYYYLVALREFDLRQGWRSWACTNCAAWMNLKCKISPGAAREKLRTAKALIYLPLTSAAFEAGDLRSPRQMPWTPIATVISPAVRAPVASCG